jgi:hypothetical protein
LQGFAVPAEYRPLHKYLSARFADTVVLTLAEIEDLLGVPLPAAARQEPAWWTNPDTDALASPQSHAWMQANRMATPHLSAHTVSFERDLD